MRLFSDCPSNNFLQLFLHKYAGADRSATGISGKTYARDLVGTRQGLKSGLEKEEARLHTKEISMCKMGHRMGAVMSQYF